MNPNINYESVPYKFPYCLNTQCKHAEKCLRYILSKLLPVERTVFSIVNPACTTPQADSCPYFKADKTDRYARGITRLLDDLPHNKAVAVKSAIRAHFSKGTLYRIQSKERLISPDEQNFFRRIFIQYGINNDPIFDEYVEQYDW